MIFRKRFNDSCVNVMTSIVNDNGLLQVYINRIKDSFFSNEGKMGPVYMEIAMHLVNDFHVTKRMGRHISAALVDTVRIKMFSFDDIEMQYIR